MRETHARGAAADAARAQAPAAFLPGFAAHAAARPAGAGGLPSDVVGGAGGDTARRPNSDRFPMRPASQLISGGATQTATTAMAAAANPAAAISTLAAAGAAFSGADASPAARARPLPTRNLVGARVGAAGGAAASSALPPTPPSAARRPVAAPSARDSPSAAAGAAVAPLSMASSSHRPPMRECPAETPVSPASAADALATPPSPLLAAWPADPVTPAPFCAPVTGGPARPRRRSPPTTPGGAARPLSAGVWQRLPPPLPRSCTPSAFAIVAAVVAAAVAPSAYRGARGLAAADRVGDGYRVAFPAFRLRLVLPLPTRAPPVARLGSAPVSPGRPAGLRARAARAASGLHSVSPPPEPAGAKQHFLRDPLPATPSGTTATPGSAFARFLFALSRSPSLVAAPAPCQSGAAACVTISTSPVYAHKNCVAPRLEL